MKLYTYRQGGYFLILAVIFILIIGVMGSMIAYLISNRSQLSVAELQGLRTFYIAESGIEAGTRLLTMPSISGSPTRLACGSITGTSAITNAAMGNGTFTITTINSSPIFSINSLSSAITASSATIPVSSTAGFAPSGRILIDQEAINYAAISGNSFIGITRGASGTLASSHASGAGVSQYQCSLNVSSGIPSIASPSYKRTLQWNVQLQDGWAVGNSSGNNFVFTRWNYPTENSWTASTVAGGGNDANLNDISMLSNKDGWAVGNEAGNFLIFLRWNGSTWALNTVNGCNGQNLLGISMVSSRNGFAVGTTYKPTSCSSGNNRYTIVYWNGTNWSLLTPSTSPSIPADNNSNQNLNAIHVIDTAGNGLGNIGFAVGNNGQILRYNGTSWTQATSPTTRNLLGVSVVSSSEAWAVGTNGTILQWNGTTWSTVSSPVTVQLNDIVMLDTNNDGSAEVGWAVGNSGRLLNYNGSTWSSTTIGNTTFTGIDFANSNDAWAVGSGGTAVHWDGNTWTTFSSDTSVRLNQISLVAAKKEPTSSWQQLFH